MITAIQVIGLLFGLFMLYLTYLYYKRRDYDAGGFVLWILIWAGLIAGILFPGSLEALLTPLAVYRMMDLFTIVSVILLFGMVFFMYDQQKKIEKKIDRLVREIALREE